MTLRLRYAARSDIGLLREGNEDSLYAGPRLLAVADGMGGHAAGEVASAVAIATLARLDEDVPPTDVLTSLREALDSANAHLRELVVDDPGLEGMGTTVTALLAAGARIGLAHIGDSRAYLLRGGQLQQITRDHTFVQGLVDDGRITPAEADTHPQRSLLTRALDGRDDIDPDLSLREVRVGDRYLLCSDGLSGVVSFDTIASTLATGDPASAVERLVELALRGGAPDNVSCVVADIVDDDDLDAAPLVDGAAATVSGLPGSNGPPGDSAAARAAALDRRAGPHTGEEDAAPVPDAARGAAPRGGGPARRWLGPLAVVLLVLVVVGAIAVAGWTYARSQYYVAADGDQVAIFRGVTGTLGGVRLSGVHSRPGPPLAALPSFTRERVEAGIPASGLGGAHAIVDRLRQEAEVACAQRSPAPAPPTAAAPLHGPSPSPTSAGGPSPGSGTIGTDLAPPSPTAANGQRDGSPACVGAAS